MIERRNHDALKLETVNGPGKAAKALGVNITDDGVSLIKKSSGIWIEDEGVKIPEGDIIKGPRVGMSIHTGVDAHRPWRFLYQG